MAKKTALHDVHKSLGAKLVEFAGFIMPIQYQGIIGEHKRVRATVGLFDISHMGEFIISGPNAEDFLNYVTVNDVSKLEVGAAQYTVMCYPDGGIVDDLLIYRNTDHYMMVVNAANIQKDWQWINQHKMDDVTLENQSDSTVLLAIQGPDSTKVVQKLSDKNVEDIGYYHFVEDSIAGIPGILSRTGYTGEVGYEVYIESDNAREIWGAIMEAGKEFHIEPIGLGARDTLRLEAGLYLYGNDIDKDTNPLEAGLHWITKLEKDDFIGKEALQAVKAKGIEKKLVGFEVMGKGIPRHGYLITFSGKTVGEVTSGTQSPTLEKGIGMGYVQREYENSGTTFNIKIRQREIPAKVVKKPFYKRKS